MKKLVIAGLALLLTIVVAQQVQLAEIQEKHQETANVFMQKNKQVQKENEAVYEELAELKTGYQGISVQNEQYRLKIDEMTNTITELQNKLEKAKKELQRITGKAPEGYEVAKAINGFEVTWYNYNSGYTFTGVPPTQGKTIAVDPNVIPLGSWVKLEFPNGKTLVRKAEDTGGVVKGQIIDVYSTASTSELMRRGRTHDVKVYVLERAGDHEEG